MLPNIFIILGIIGFFLILQGLIVIIIIRRFTVKNIKQEMNNLSNSLLDLEMNIKELEINLNKANENKTNDEPVIASVLSPSEEEMLLAGTNSSKKPKLFDFLNRSDPDHLLNILQQEHPQTIALVLSHLKPNKASVILQNLPDEIQSDIIRRIIWMYHANPKIVGIVEHVLEQRFASSANVTYTGGVECAIEILSGVDLASEKKIIQALEDENPELAEELKKRIFVFEDIILLEDRAIQKVMREVDSQELAKALKSVKAEVQEKIFRNMSTRAAAMIKEEMEYMGPVRLSDVENAQSKIVMIIRHLEDTGEIAVARAGDELLV